jgi:hypothetical protein
MSPQTFTARMRCLSSLVSVPPCVGRYVDGAAVLGQGVREAHLGKPGQGWRGGFSARGISQARWKCQGSPQAVAARINVSRCACAPSLCLLGRASAWDYALVALVHPSVVRARVPLAALGWTVLERDLPFPLSDVENQVRHAQAGLDRGSTYDGLRPHPQ